jgi:hypothetical protein
LASGDIVGVVELRAVKTHGNFIVSKAFLQRNV